MSQLFGIVLMILSSIFLSKFIHSLIKDAKELGKYGWLLILKEAFTGVSVLLIIIFSIGLLLVIKPF